MNGKTAALITGVALASVGIPLFIKLCTMPKPLINKKEQKKIASVETKESRI